MSDNLIGFMGPKTSITPTNYDLTWLDIYQNPFAARKPNPQPIDDRSPRLYFTIGAPRSGKSTLARKWLMRDGEIPEIAEPDDGRPRFMWDSDLMRLELYGKRYYRKGDPMVYAVKNYGIRVALATGSDVIVAGTHSSRSSIRRILEIDPHAIPVLVDTPVEICLERAKDTGQEDLLEIIPRVCEQIEDLKWPGIKTIIAGILSDIKNRRPY